MVLWAIAIFQGEFIEFLVLSPKVDFGASRTRFGKGPVMSELEVGRVGSRWAAGGRRARATSEIDGCRAGGLPIEETKATASLRDSSAVAGRERGGDGSSLRASSRDRKSVV